jgi:hypothetical protein
MLTSAQHIDPPRCADFAAPAARRPLGPAALIAWLARGLRRVLALSGDPLENYLAGSVDHADLEYRMRVWHDIRSRDWPEGRH